MSALSTSTSSKSLVRLAISLFCGSCLASLVIGLLCLHSPPDVLAAGTYRYVDINGIDAGTCPDSNPCASLSYALSQGVDGDTIIIKAGTFTDTVTISKSVTIEGSDADDTIIQVHSDQSQATSRVFTVSSSGVVTITDITIRNGNSNENGGGIKISSDLVLEDCVIENNSATGYGGGVYIEHGTPTLVATKTQILSNTAQRGAGIYIDASAVNLKACQLNNNTATYHGGGAYVTNGGSLMVDGGDMSFNQANSGGGIYLWDDSHLQASNVEFIGNNATTYGGGAMILGGQATFDQVDFGYNTASKGGGLRVTNSSTTTVVINDGGFWYNSASSQGGAVSVYGNDIYDSKAEIRLDGTWIMYNSARWGGALDVWGDGQNTAYAVLTQTRLLSNTASSGEGSAILSYADAELTMAGGCVVNNPHQSVENSEGNTTLSVNNVWWGAVDGPSGEGPGSGDSVSANVNYANFLTTASTGCQVRYGPARVTVAGPAAPVTGTSYIFTATVAPNTTVLPLTVTWEADGQTTTTSTVNTDSDTISFTWPTTGTRQVTVTAQNESDQAAGSAAFDIEPVPTPPVPNHEKVYLPAVMKNK